MGTSSHFQPDEIDGVLAAAQVGVWIWEGASGLSTWNQAMFEIFEISEQEFDGTYGCWKHRIHPEDVALLESIARACLQSDRLLKMKYRVVTSDGLIKIVKNRVRGIADASGKLVKIVGVNIDVTDTVRAQEDLAISERTLFQARQMTQMALWEEDLVTGELTLSTELSSYLGPNRRVPTSEDFISVVVPQDRERVVKARRDMLETGVLMDVEYRIQTPQGIRFRHSRAEIIYDSSGRPTRVMGVTHDLTERRKIEEERFQLQQRLMQIEKLDSLGTFAGGIAHDFNNFLAAIGGQIELATEQKKSADEMQGVLEKILQISHRAQDLVSRILTFSKVPQLRSEKVEIKGLINETIGILEASISNHIDLRIDPVPETLGFQGDRIQVQQVLINIINNAVQALGDQPGGIHLQAQVVPADLISGFPSEVAKGTILAAEYTCIQIADTGPGISREAFKKIFDPMFTTKAPQQGTGLGLSVSQSIIRGHGGWISVTSDGKHGSTFQVFLPIAGGHPVESKIVLRAQGAPRIQKILIVDDDTEVLALLVEAMEVHKEFNVVAYSDSTAALQAFRSDPDGWSLIVTDLTMPGLNGVELCRSAHALREDLPVILITGFDRSQVMNQEKISPNTHVLLKPFRMQTLRERIQELTTATTSPGVVVGRISPEEGHAIRRIA